MDMYLWQCLSLSLFQGNTIESEHLSELTEEEYEAQIFQRQDLKGFLWLDAKYLNPFFTRRLTQEVRLLKPLYRLVQLTGFVICRSSFLC